MALRHDDVKPVVFDLEGTLVNLEDIHQKSFEKIASQLDVKFGKEEFHNFVGAGDAAISEYIYNRFIESNPEDSLYSSKRIRALKKVVYNSMLKSRQIKPREGVLDYLEKARSQYGTLVIASLTPPDQAKHIVETSGKRFFWFCFR